MDAVEHADAANEVLESVIRVLIDERLYERRRHRHQVVLFEVMDLPVEFEEPLHRLAAKNA